MAGGLSLLWLLVPTAVAAGFAAGSRRRARPSARPFAPAGLPLILRDALWEWDVRADRFTIPVGLLNLTGYTAAEFGVRLAEVARHVPAEQRDALLRRVGASLHGDATEIALEFKLAGKGGGFRPIAVRAAIERDEAGELLHVSGTWTDIAARVEAEEERDRLFNVSIDLLAVAGFDGYLQQVNPAWVRVLGWSRDDLMSRALLDFIHPDDRDRMAGALGALVEDRTVPELAARFRCRDGSYRWLSWSSFPYPDRRLVFSVVRDITEQKDAEQRLLEYQDRLRSLSAQLAVAEERERRQLAVAIHDGLAQQLFAARAKVTLLRYPEKLPDQRQIVDEALGILDDSMREARSLSFELYPPVLYEVGLEAALAWLARQWSERTGIACTLDTGGGAGELEDIGEDLRALAYQSARELLANVAKHATANLAEITLALDERDLRLAVTDDGRGLAEEPESGAASGQRDASLGFGLFSIRERVRSVGGRFRLDSRPGEGCRVELCIPLAAPGRGAPAVGGPDS